MFKTDAILLHSQKIRDNSMRYIFLTKDYGKISCFHKKSEQIGSTGDILSILIERKDGINILKHKESKISIHFYKPNYIFLLSFLGILKILYEFLGDSDMHEGVFDDYVHFIQHLSKSPEQRLQDSILFQVRILKRLGFIDGTEFSIGGGTVGSYIYTHIDTKSIQNILGAKALETPLLHFIQNLIHKTVYQSIL